MLKLMANWIELWAWIINKLAYVAKKKILEMLVVSWGDFKILKLLNGLGE